ncbi:MAG TPA: TVP38/TMEM64 family protein [Dongiaceae bacterium]|jgi:uncharacterized membrane protein YdjX (TVP38/TMEM64 family)|nr:TVP38/TMEM64 family protein [Dongiaceae bacterium]
MTRNWLRWLALALLLVALGTVWVSGAAEWLSPSALRIHYGEWRAFVEAHFLWAALIFFLAYVVCVALSVPGGTILTVFGGCLFGALWGTALAVCAATSGAVIIFLIARSSLGAFLRARAGPWLVKLQDGFARDEWSYMFALRFLPIVPFWVANLAPALLNVRLRVFAVATLLGIIPGTAIYATFGAGLGELIVQNQEFSLRGILTPKIIGAFVALAVVALLPALARRLRRA